MKESSIMTYSRVFAGSAGVEIPKQRSVYGCHVGQASVQMQLSI